MRFWGLRYPVGYRALLEGLIVRLPDNLWITCRGLVKALVNKRCLDA